MSSNEIMLTSSDNQTFEVNEEVAREFHIVAQLIEDRAHIKDDGTTRAIPLQNVTGKILAKVIEYCKEHVERSKEEEKDEAKKQLENWDTEFIKDLKVDMNTIFEVLLAANYLNVKTLLELACDTIADYIKDMKVEEVRTIFTVENDYTPEEEEAVRKENEWAFH